MRWTDVEVRIGGEDVKRITEIEYVNVTPPCAHGSMSRGAVSYEASAEFTVHRATFVALQLIMSRTHARAKGAGLIGPGASVSTLAARARYGGRKGARAMRRLDERVRLVRYLESL